MQKKKHGLQKYHQNKLKIQLKRNYNTFSINTHKKIMKRNWRLSNVVDAVASS